MRKNDAAHGASTFGELFAARHVYLRSGAASQYVVLSRPLQIGVVVGGALTLAAFACAGYSAIAGRLAAIEQRREIARLELVIRTLRSDAADHDAAAAQLRPGTPPQAAMAEGPGGAARQPPGAVKDGTRAAALAQRAGRDQPLTASAREALASTEAPAGTREPAAARAPELAWRLAHAGEALARLAVQLAAAETAAIVAARPPSVQPAQAGRDDGAANSLAQLKADGPDGQLQQLRRQLASAAATSALLGEDLAAAQRELAASRTRAGATFGPDDAREIARLRAQLGRANQRIALLEAQPDPGAGPRAPAPAPPAPR